jgi:hypothetical protein
MKFGELKSIGHNISASLGGGIGILIGVYEMDVFGEAASSPEGFIEVDFLTGATSGGRLSPTLMKAIALYAGALAGLCEKHGTSPEAFRQLRTRYWVEGLTGRYQVTVENHEGRVSVDEYCGLVGHRATLVDDQGRIRPKPGTQNVS